MSETVFEWARALSTEHECIWDEVVTTNTGYDPIDLVCRICDRVKHTAMVRVVW